MDYMYRLGPVATHPLLQGVATPWGLETSFFLSYVLLPPSVSMSYFILAIRMCKCLGKHTCTSSTFPVARLHGENGDEMQGLLNKSQTKLKTSLCENSKKL